MIKINVKIDMSGALAKIARARKQIPFATALALTNTARAVAMTDIPASIKTTFKSAVPFTQKAAYFSKATKSDLLATVGLKEKQAAYLRTEITGGLRPAAIEKFLTGVIPSGMYAVPTKFTKTTSSGKVSPAWLRKIASQLTAGPGPIVGRKRRAAKKPFLVTNASQGLHPGIWQTEGVKAVPLLLFVRQAKYSRRWDFYGAVGKAARSRFPAEFQRALKQALASAR